MFFFTFQLDYRIENLIRKMVAKFFQSRMSGAERENILYADDFRKFFAQSR